METLVGLALAGLDHGRALRSTDRVLDMIEETIATRVLEERSQQWDAWERRIQNAVAKAMGA